MKTAILILSVILFFHNCEEPEEPSEETFIRTFGGIHNDEGYCVQETPGGGYIIAADTDSYGSGNSDVWLIKTDASGDAIWTNTFGGSKYDYGRSVLQTTEGGYVMMGYTHSYGAGRSDAWLIKTDALGDTLWTKTFGGIETDKAFSVQKTIDGEYIIIGETRSSGAGSADLWLIKTEASGDTVWTKTFGGVGLDIGLSVQQTSDGGYIITGSTNNYGAIDLDIWLIKMDALGNAVWAKTYGGISTDEGVSVQQTIDLGYIIAGYTHSYGAGNSDIWLIKTDASGDSVWAKTFGGSGYDEGQSVQQTSDGGYIITGYTDSYGAGDGDVWLIKTDALGDTVWTRTFGSNLTETGHSVRQTSDGGYIITGYTNSYGAGGWDVLLIKTDENGNAG